MRFSPDCAGIIRHLQCHPQGTYKNVPVAGRGGLWGSETSRPQYFLESRLTDGGAVSLTLRHAFTSREIPGSHFC
jgi:hypothetical protein